MGSNFITPLTTLAAVLLLLALVVALCKGYCVLLLTRWFTFFAHLDCRCAEVLNVGEESRTTTTEVPDREGSGSAEA